MIDTVTSEDIAYWRTWIGKTETRTEILEAESLRRYAAAILEDLDIERRLPSLAHWAFFLPVVSASAIGEDGHPHRGGFLPPITLARRMFASSNIHFGAGLRVGHAAVRRSTITDVKHRSGRSGDLVLVDVEHRITQDGAECILERQSIVFREDGGRTEPIEPIDQPVDAADQLWEPGPVDLFRFSAATFNSHRIHYDLPYTTEVEGYPGLIVHGPFTAARLCGYAARDGRPLKRFSFRATAPLFALQRIRLTAGEQADEYRAIRCDGAVAMSAVVER